MILTSFPGALVSAVNLAGSFTPVVDGPNGFLPGLPSELFAAGNYANVDFIGGHCTNDGRTFVNGLPSDFVSDSDIIQRTLARWDVHMVLNFVTS